MDSNETGGRCKRLGSALVGAGLALLAVRSFRNGKRLRGVATSAGALAFGYTAATAGNGTVDEFETDIEEDTTTGGSATVGTDADTTTGTTSEPTTTDSGTDSRLTCAACGEPIVIGQRRGPNENDDIVHDDCA